MRTTESQFEVLVDFMERHGDLNKPADGPINIAGRIKLMKKWDELSSALNTDPIGKSKPTEKWKKVWSDLKNNTKRKAMKLATRGPKSTHALTESEKRVLNIIGFKMECIESRSSADRMRFRCSSPRSESMEPSSPVDQSRLRHSPQPESNEPQSTTNRIKRRYSMPQPEPVGSQSIRDHIKRRYSPPQEPTRPVLQSQRQHTSQQSSDHDDDWRNLTTEFVTENVRLRERELELQTQWQNLATDFITENVRLREQNVRLRERELQQQRQWQTLFTRCLDIFERFVDGNRESV